MSDWWTESLTDEEARHLSEVLGHKAKARTVTPSPFLRALARAFVLAPLSSEERLGLADMIDRVATESGASMRALLLNASAELEAEGLL